MVTELKSGNYVVSVEQPGFKRAVQPAFKLDINQVVRVDVTLVPGRGCRNTSRSLARRAAYGIADLLDG